MYIVEVILKKLLKKKDEPEYNPVAEDTFIEDYEACEHIFMPIDSTNETLSCTKCGILKNRSELKNRNFFESGL